QDAVDAVLRVEFEKVALKLVQSHQEAWHLLDLVTSYVRTERRRARGILREFQEKLSAQLNERRAAIASGRPELRDDHKWQAFRQQRRAKAEQCWQDCTGRLARNPHATLDEPD